MLEFERLGKTLVGGPHASRQDYEIPDILYFIVTVWWVWVEIASYVAETRQQH